MKEIKAISYSESGSDKNRELDLYIPDIKGFPVYIFFHGGGLESGSKDLQDDLLCKTLLNNNIAVAAAEYRKYPEAKYPDFIDDGAAAADWVIQHIKNYGGSGKFVIGGSSAGAYIAMMLCMDKRYLEQYGIDSHSACGYIFNGGQPTTHFHVLRERGFDTGQVIIDDASPLFYMRDASALPPIQVFIAENDIPCRYEQNLLFIKALDTMGYSMENLDYHYMKGYNHCEYEEKGDETYISAVCHFIKKVTETDMCGNKLER